MISFTLDTNCVLAVDEMRPEASDVLRLAEAHAAGNASVSLVAISASERQKSGMPLESFEEFKKRIATLNLGHLSLLKPMMYWDVTFWDYCLWSDETMQQLEKQIHEILFPNIEFLWSNYSTMRGLDSKGIAQDKKWRNAKCDVQAYWSHTYNKRDVFVTSDQNFHGMAKKAALVTILGGRIETPESAARVLL